MHVQGADRPGPGMGGLFQQQAIVEIHADASIGSVAYLHGGSCEALIARQRRQLHFQAGAHSDDVVVTYFALVTQTEDTIQIQMPVELAVLSGPATLASAGKKGNPARPGRLTSTFC